MSLFDADAGKAAGAIKDYYKKSRKDLMPYMELGQWAIPGVKETDITGGAGEFLNKLKNFGSTFQVNPEDPTYKFRVGEAEKGVNSFLASRGLYNSRAGLNALQETTTQIGAEEAQNQYNRGYQNILDSFNLASSLGQSQFSKLYNLLGVGANAAGQSASSAMQAGQGIANATIAGGQAKTGLVSDLIGLGGNALLLKYFMGGNN